MQTRSVSSPLLKAALTCALVALACVGHCARAAGILSDFRSEARTVYSYSGPELAEMPWEIADGRGAIILPDLFYADAAQNEQIMPTEVTLAAPEQKNPIRYQIDRLIYPTIGNPRLVVLGGADGLPLVLRLEKALYSHLEPRLGAPLKTRPHVSRLFLEKTDSGNRILFYLVPRGLRSQTHEPGPAGGQGLVALAPARVFVHSVDAFPEELRVRDTLRFTVRARDLNSVAPALYDLRLEVWRDGKMIAHEFQYNAVRVFEKGADAGDYHVLNVSDTQVSVSDILDGVPKKFSFREISQAKLKQFVRHVNESSEPSIRNSVFITFNGDLHNGGSPGTLLPEGVARIYNDEAAGILPILRELNFPIFLVAGNHDGYASTGHVPGPIATAVTKKRLLGAVFRGGEKIKSLEQVVRAASGDASWEKLSAAVRRTAAGPGGRHEDIFTGRFVQRGRLGKGGSVYWKRVPENRRNVMLYDGFHQWRRSYGPLYYSFNFGRNHYLAANSYDLRQHRRTGWGMYTVNYGGGISAWQMNFIRRDLKRADGKFDIILLAHHDPRGGHRGKDFPYYFEQIDYNGMGESALNFVNGEFLAPMKCAKVPAWAKSARQVIDCMHDGLQDWLRADRQFDCREEDLVASGPHAGTCDQERYKIAKNHPIYSGYQLLHRLAHHRSLRTVILGHTHYNSLEVLLPGDEIIPGRVVLDAAAQEKYAALEVDTPLRSQSKLSEQDGARQEKKYNVQRYNQERLDKIGVVKENSHALRIIDLALSGHDFQKKLLGHELVVLRVGTEAQLSFQNLSGGAPMLGFAVFDIKQRADARRVELPQLNGVTYYHNQDGRFRSVLRVPLDRTKRLGLRGEGNPLQGVFRLKN